MEWKQGQRDGCRGLWIGIGIGRGGAGGGGGAVLYFLFFPGSDVLCVLRAGCGEYLIVWTWGRSSESWSERCRYDRALSV